MTCKDTGVYISIRKLPALGKSTAESTKLHGTVRGASIAEGIGADLRRIKAAAAECSEFYGNSTDVPKAAEWLLDNWYIADREGLAAASDLRASGRLPKDGSRGCSAIEVAAAVLVSGGRGEVTEERITLFLNGYQDGRILTERELAAFIPVLKAALISFLKSACDNGLDNDDAPAVMENIFTSLRFLESFSSPELMESVNRVDAVLRTDPAGVYSRMDEKTRSVYRACVSRLARRHGTDEYSAAKRAIELAGEHDRHVGHYLFKEPLGGKVRKKSGGGYIASMVVVSLFLTVLLGVVLDNILVTVLLLFPIWAMVKNVFDFIIAKHIPPVWLPRLELKKGIPAEGKTLCVISILLTSRESAKQAARLLEEFSITNRDAGSNLNFGLLADLREADARTTPQDREIVDYASGEIQRLNGKYGGRFYLFLRERTMCRSSGKYMSWERKRGAILELVRRLKGKPSGIITKVGDDSGLENTRFIITLDSDTRLTSGAAVQLVGTAMHPLNRPVIGEDGAVTDGYGILQPRVSVELKSAIQSDFTRIFAGQGGIDPYGGSASDVYQDLYGSGSFIGKGLIDVDAYYRCLDKRFPTDRILSHDLLEGAFIGCGYMSDTELVDSCPPKVVSYYERMHRWVRGDWQNCVYLGGRIKNAVGEDTKNPLSDLNKWKIFDNLRRSLTPVFTLFALLSAMLSPRGVFGWAALVAMLSALSDLLISSAALLFRRNTGTKFLSGVISGFGGLLMQTLIKLMLLPYEAWICLSAIVTSLYRMTVSKRDLLQWTTAADSDKRAGATVGYYYKKMWACLVIGAVILILSPYASACAVGVVWLLTPFYAWALSKGIEHVRHISAKDRQFLLSAAGDIWRYFDDLVTPADSFLPPDNWQEQPSLGAAHRTSPTNIGLALLSALAAIDLGLATRERALGVIENILTSVVRLPKWNGHLYNWYDTRTCRVLEPKYVSTVDSGNLAGSLIALREGLTELGEDRLASVADSLYNAMSFAPLYDAKRMLFHIGWDAVNNRPTRSYYDLLASEARQTSYVAIAKGDVPRKHWRMLSRALVSLNGYCGMASWTGTMFEYLMPNLLLPCYRDSLLYESARFCVYVQKQRKGMPVWGESESAFYSFDPALNYRYKAHGVQKLALKRGLEADSVISPYSSFLALNVDFKASLNNLKALRQMGAEGKYGFYEAVDFTAERTGDEDRKLVRTFMVHHLGMSLISIDNALMDGIMQKRFMRDINMASFSELLQEKIPSGAVVLHKKPREVPEKPMRSRYGEWVSESGEADRRNPKCWLLSNGAYTVLLNDSGGGRSSWGGVQVTRFSPEQDSSHRGLEIGITADDGEIMLTPGFERDPDVRYGAEFTGGYGRISARTNRLAASMTVRVPEDENGETRVITVNRTDDSECPGTLTVRFTPVLAKSDDFEAHPLFSKLSLEAKVTETGLVIRRRPRGDRGEMYLCAVCDKPVTWTTEGGTARDRRPVMKGYSTEMTVTGRISFSLKPDSAVAVKLALGVGETEEAAVTAAGQTLLSRETAGSHLDRCATELDLAPKDIREAMGYMTDLLYVSDERRRLSEAVAANTEGREGLWRFGISGDLPIMTMTVSGEEELKRALEVVKQHSLLSENGFSFDLVLIADDNGDYMMPRRRAITECLRRLGREHRIGARGGVHLVDGSSPYIDVIKAMSGKIEGIKEDGERGIQV